MDDDQAPRRRGLSVNVIGPRPGLRAAVGLGRWLESAAPARARGEVNIALVSDAHMRRMNSVFRGVDAVTDVLSFPSGETTAWLGDIAIAVGRARRQARAERHALRTEFRVLALHGLLHLLGYDHERDDGRMRRAEERLRRRAGLPSGVIARATRTAAAR